MASNNTFTFYLITTGVADNIYKFFDKILENTIKIFGENISFIKEIKIIHFDPINKDFDLLDSDTLEDQQIKRDIDKQYSAINKKLQSHKIKFSNIIKDILFILEPFTFELLRELTNNEIDLENDIRLPNHLIIDFAHLFKYISFNNREIIPVYSQNNKQYKSLNVVRFSYPDYKNNCFYLHCYLHKYFQFSIKHISTTKFCESDYNILDFELITYIDKLNNFGHLDKSINTYYEHEPSEFIYELFFNGKQSVKHNIENYIMTTNNLNNIFELDDYFTSSNTNIRTILNNLLPALFKLLWVNDIESNFSILTSKENILNYILSTYI